MAKPRKQVEGVYERVAESGIWYGRYRDTTGRLIKRSFGEDHAKAKRWVEDRRSDRRKGIDPYSTDRKGVTLGELLDDHLDFVKANPEKYRDQTTPAIHVRNLKVAFGKRLANGLKPKDISEWLDELRTGAIYPGKDKLRRKVSPATKNKYKATLSAAFKRGKYNDKCSHNPCRDVESAKPREGVIRFLTDAEEIRLRAALDQMESQAERSRHYKEAVIDHHRCELDVALQTGMRRGEIYKLTWEQVDFARREVLLTMTKNGSSRIVLLNERALKAFEKLKALATEREERKDFVFAIEDPKKWFQAACRDAEIKNFRFHDLRHTFCSRLAMNGENFKVIAELAGHKTLQMTARYAHLDDSTKRKALERLNAA